MTIRRALLGGLAALLLLPGVALAQAQTATTPRGKDQAEQPRRTRPAELSFEQLNAKQRRRVGHALAGYGNPPVAPDQAAARWNGMTTAQRRQALRSYRDAVRAAKGSTGAAPAARAVPPVPGPGGATIPPMPGPGGSTVPPMPGPGGSTVPPAPAAPR